MNRFSAREFALLCAPVALIAGAGLWVATRPAPVPLHLDFRVEKPTTLEAFGGANMALVARIRGDGAPNVAMDSMKTASFLEVQTAQGTQRASSQSWTTPSAWDKVWKGQIYGKGGLRLPINALAIPAGNLAFRLKTQPISANSQPGAPAATPRPPLQGKWKIDRSQFAPFDFAKLPRSPQVQVRGVKIVAVTVIGIEGEISFDLLGAGMNAQTPVDVDLSGTVAFKGTTYGSGRDSEATVDPKNPQRRTMNWNLGGPASPPPKTFGDLHGRISADERWPLAFQLDPINMSKVKSGQILKFRQWTAPIPK